MSLHRYSQAHETLERVITLTQDEQERREYEIKLREIERQITNNEQGEPTDPLVKPGLTARQDS